MAKSEGEVEVVRKYYFRKDGVTGQTAYDWIGKPFHGLYPVELGDKLGFADDNGSIVVPIIYDRYGHINDSTGLGNDEYLVMRKKGMYGVLKHDGTITVEFKWKDMVAYKLSENLLPVTADGKKWGYVNIATGAQITPAYNEVGVFRNGYASVRVKKKWGLIDADGNMITEPKYLAEFNFSGDFAIVLQGGSIVHQGDSNYGYYKAASNSNWKILNKKGYEIETDCCEISRITDITNIFAITRKENRKEIRILKQFIAFPDYIVTITGSAYMYNEKYIREGIWSVIDYTGTPITIPEEELKKIKENLIAGK